MAGYTKNIAVIKGVKGGFSTDGGVLSGLIKTEKYGGFLRAEATFINFAPLSEGRYVTCISDGANEEIFDGKLFEGESEVDTSYGFAAAVCFVLKGDVNLIATAICGDYAYAADYAKRAVERAENVFKDEKDTAYDDEALAEDNYYEREKVAPCEDSGTVCQTEKQEKEVKGGTENENTGSLCEEPQERAEQTDVEREVTENGQAEPVPLATDIGFYNRVKPEIERIFCAYPKEDELERIIEDSRWARISYGKGKFYVFGVIMAEGVPEYICYGVPSSNPKKPPESLKGMAGFIPSQTGGYWVMYQDAGTGLSVKIENS